ncbi:unnamed protein product [Orchesella dallaii]|uniref:Selenocysteine lyase n=1 Tax=Orchesella dallaii TaxID=48710 RepID=A0ABP1RTG2_9HEXA
MNGSSEPSEKGPIYLDYNATTPLDPLVIEEVHRSLIEDWGNPSSSHELGRQAKAAIERSRASIARMLNANPEDIVFTSGGTEANNIALLSAIQSRSSLDNSKPHCISSNVEHDSIARVLQEQLRLGNIELSLAEVDQDGKLHLEGVLSLIRDTTCLISIMHANNESGVIMPIDEVGDRLQTINEERKRAGLRRIIFHCDAAQTIGKIGVDVEELKVDLLTIVGHKFYAPRIGALYVKHLTTGSYPIQHVFQGGGQERGFRPGTENTPMITGLGKAAELVYENLQTYTETMRKMRDLLTIQLQNAVPGIRINFAGVADKLPNTLSICIPDGLTASFVLNVGCKDKLLASLGAACHSNTEKPSAILLASGLSPAEASRTIRLSVGRTTTAKEVEEAVKVLKQVCLGGET